MIKYLVLLFNMLGMILFRAFFVEDVTVTQNMPAKANPGDEITVEITVKKGALAGVGHIKQEIPEGFTATVVEAKGAAFKFLEADKIVKFTWVSLPGDAEFTVSYKLKIPAAAKGSFSIGGRFSYIENNDKKTVEMNAVQLQVGEGTAVVSTPTVAPTPTTTTTVTTPTTTTTQPEPTPTTATTATTTTTTTTEPTNKTPEPAQTELSVSRKAPAEANAGDEFTVEVSITKGNMSGFARFQDILPDGFTASELNSKGGKFSFMEGKAKIVWDNMPADPQFTVSYKVKAGANVSGDKTIEGQFSYVKDKMPDKYVIPSSTVSVKGTAVAVTPTTTTTFTTTVTQPETTTATTAVTITEPVKTNKEPTVTNVPTPEKKVKYSVQICATHSSPASAYFQNRYGLSEKVKMEAHEGWNKYTVGSFGVYKDARDHREEIRPKVSDAFVTAYNNGGRITVQEALMITSQQWFR